MEYRSLMRTKNSSTEIYVCEEIEEANEEQSYTPPVPFFRESLACRLQLPPHFRLWFTIHRQIYPS